MNLLCQGVTKCGNTCKRKAENLNDFCSFHKQIFCNKCKLKYSTKNSINLDCGHNFCKTCLANEIYTNQWFEGFSTENPLICPECDINYLILIGKISWTTWSFLKKSSVELFIHTILLVNG